MVDREILSGDQVESALARQASCRNPIGRLLVEDGSCKDEEVLRALGEQMGFMVMNRIPEAVVDPEALAIIPAAMAVKRQILPLVVERGTLRIAISDPFDFGSLDEAAFACGMPVEAILAPVSEIQRWTAQKYMQQVLRSESGSDEIELLGEDESDIDDLQRMAGDAVVIRWVNVLLRGAVQDRASDIHIEPFEKGVRVRYRVDGILMDVSAPPGKLQPAIVSRIKIIANMDIAERRVPQDGRIKLRVASKDVDVRVSTMPTVFGESVALRILERSGALFGLVELGLLPDDRQRLEGLLQIPHGILLVTGPTGSGKTTTLYAALRQTYSSEKKVITIEDPVEYLLEGVNQIQVRPKVGLTFANGLRHIVRQDPDILMVGEIRDGETAEIAIHAALTGHLVFSTLHTNDSAGAIVRLLDMGIEPFLVSSSVEAVIAQRLVRKLCPHCSVAEIGRTGRRRPVGCEECRHTGYRGRTGIFEILVMDDELRSLVARRAPAADLMESASRRGTRMLLQDGLRKIEMGLTTIEEVTRVSRHDDPSNQVQRVTESAQVGAED